MELLRSIADPIFRGAAFEAVLALFISLTLLVLSYNTLALARRVAVTDDNKHKTKKSDRRSAWRRVASLFLPTWKKVIFINAVFFLALVLFLVYYFLSRPYVSAYSPEAGVPWNDQTQPIRITFDRPVNPEIVKFNMSPNTPGRLEWIPGISAMPEGLRTYRVLEFYPERTLPASQPVIVYLVGLSDLAESDGVHEAAIEFTPPTVPEIETSSIAAGQKDVLTNTGINLIFSHPNGPFVKWEFKLEPNGIVPILQEQNSMQWRLSFPEELKQAQDYKLVAYRTLREIELASGTVVKSGDAEKAFELEFTTVRPPFIKKVTPSGNSVRVSEPLNIEFDLDMETASLEGKFTIAPETAGELNWTSPRTLNFQPEGGWKFDTAYTIKITEGLRSSAGGVTESSLSHKFRTLGAVKVTSTTPADGSSGVDPNTSITVTFDQEVDHASAQERFQISPAVSGSFSWHGNTMTFKPTGSLAADTAYTVTIRKGVISRFGKNSDKDQQFRFSTRAESFMLSMTWRPQEESFTCNIAATRMVLEYRGIGLSESQIKNGVGIQNALLSNGTGGDPNKGWVNYYGILWGPIHSFINGYRSNSVKQSWDLTSMLTEVRNGNPSILWWHNRWSSWYWKSWTTSEGDTINGLNGMHSEIVIGYQGSVNNPTTVITLDPWRGLRYYGRSDFESIWTNSFNRTAIVIY